MLQRNSLTPPGSGGTRLTDFDQVAIGIADVGAKYTHFGGMNGLIGAIAAEAFARFNQALTEVPETDDPLGDFLVMGLGYRRFALANPQRYQLIFGVSSPEAIARDRADLTVTGSATSRGEGSPAFDAMRSCVRRMIAAGRMRDDGEAVIAGRLWSVIHGAVMLEMAGFFGHEGHGVTQVLGPLTVDVLVGMGDDREKTNLSLTVAAAAAEDFYS
jgi:AcrR family transcriptional regulator